MFLGEFVPPLTEWPTDLLASIFADYGFADPLPAFEDGYFYEVEDSIMIAIVVDDAYQAIDDYSDILDEAGFELVGYDSYDDSPYFESPEGEYTVNPYAYDEEYFVIALY